MTRLYLRGVAQRAEGDDEPGGPIRFVVATEGRKADGLNLSMDGLDLDRFLANPVVMYGHDYFGRESLPIGRAESVEVVDGQLMADTVFDMSDEFAARVDAKYRGGFLNAVSVSFDIHDMDEETGDVSAWEMIEYSAVPVPLDPDAVAESGRLRAFEVASALAEQREGEVLSSTNKSAVEDAIGALKSLLEKADEADVEDDDEADDGRGMPLAVARRRLRLREMTAQA